MVERNRDIDRERQRHRHRETETDRDRDGQRQKQRQTYRDRRTESLIIFNTQGFKEKDFTQRSYNLSERDTHTETDTETIKR